MSALGQKQTLKVVCAMSALPPKADMDQHGRDVCFVPKADIGTQPPNVRFPVARSRQKRTRMSPTIGGDIENKEEGLNRTKRPGEASHFCNRPPPHQYRRRWF